MCTGHSASGGVLGYRHGLPEIKLHRVALQSIDFWLGVFFFFFFFANMILYK